MTSKREIKASSVEGIFRHEGGRYTLIITDDAGQIDVELQRDMVPRLAMVALLNTEATFDHDGMRLAVHEGNPALSFRFGPDRWLSILLKPQDLDLLRSALTGRPSTPPGTPPRH